MILALDLKFKQIAEKKPVRSAQVHEIVGVLRPRQLLVVLQFLMHLVGHLADISRIVHELLCLLERQGADKVSVELELVDLPGTEGQDVDPVCRAHDEVRRFHPVAHE